jgi:type II secretory pathway pseudopilin PulG
MKKKKPANGMTLIEIMIYSVLIGVVLTGVYSVLLFSLRYFRAIDNMTTLQNKAMTVTSRLEDSFRDSGSDSVTIAPLYLQGSSQSSFTGVMFPSPKNVKNEYLFNNEGEIMWQKWVCIAPELQRDGTIDLVMKEVEVTPSAGTPENSPYSNVKEFAGAYNVDNKRVLARGISGFTVARAQAGSPVFNIQVTVDDTCDKNKPNNIRLETQVMLRN